MLYSEDHVWVEQKGDIVRIGLSDFAQKELGELAYIEMPEIGAVVKKTSVLCSLDSLKAASDIYAPISGTVAAVNSTVIDQVTLVNTDPLGAGWLCEIKPSDPADLDCLMPEDEYLKYVAD